MNDEQKKYGGMLPKGALYQTVHVVDAKSPDEKESYQVGLMPDSSPIVQSKQTGKRWRINWKRLIELAIDEGVDSDG